MLPGIFLLILVFITPQGKVIKEEYQMDNLMLCATAAYSITNDYDKHFEAGGEGNILAGIQCKPL